MTSVLRKEVNNPQDLTVSQLIELLNGLLEAGLPRLRFVGEISQLSAGPSGHIYFTVKDEFSQISCAMWRSNVLQLTFRPKAGDHVILEGRPSIYSKSGRFQIIVHRIEPAGEGALQKKFLELKAKLEKEGLFELSRKRALPFLPSSIGIVTSSQGAVIHDIMVRIRERMPSLKLFLVDVRVQGEGAAQEIADAIKLFNEKGCVDLIIVARGGGSLEDLWAFNEEIVVRAIFGSRVPVVSGVGHEVDVTLADLVADLRAPTPTAAAEMVVPRKADLLEKIAEVERRLLDIERWFQPLFQALDDCSERLELRMTALLRETTLRLESAQSKLQRIHPQRVLANLRATITLLHERIQSILNMQCQEVRGALLMREAKLEFIIKRRIDQERERLHRFSETLRALSPLRVLDRGFALVEKSSGLVRSAAELQVGDALTIRFAHDAARARVEEKISLIDERK